MNLYSTVIHGLVSRYGSFGDLCSLCLVIGRSSSGRCVLISFMRGRMRVWRSVGNIVGEKGKKKERFEENKCTGKFH